ncbi:MAG: hypothetical protein WKG01_33940 [Kofleriaceae bacterium]
MHELPRSRTLSLSLLAGCATALAGPDVVVQQVDPVASLRAEGPAGLARLLDRHDRMAEGPARDALANTIDAVAAQRYATVSRLYWYTDLGTAQAAAREQQRPILALRLLGRLDEDLSCANSRLFRTVLYANGEVSKFLRDNFVLYWSSERPAPRVTIDYGDGRKIERTTTGNSAHYVLDDRGRVLDVLPGLYAPAIFKAELARSLALAKHVRGKAQPQLAIRQYHAAASAAVDKMFAGVAGAKYVRPAGVAAAGESEVGRAERMTVSKAVMEIPDLERIGIAAGAVPTEDIGQWFTIGQRVWNLVPKRQSPNATWYGILDERSLALITRLHNAGPETASLPDLTRMLGRLEQNVIADSALNQFRLRQQIRERLVASESLAFEPLNEWIYAHVFATPKADAWLGLLPRTDFTGLPGDGVVMQ